MSAWFIGLILAFGFLLSVRTVLAFRAPNLQIRISGRNAESTSWKLKSLAQLGATGKKSNSVKLQIMFELPEIAELLAVALAAGETLYSAIQQVAFRANGVFPRELQNLIKALDLGSNLPTELDALVDRVPGRQVAEFSSKLQLAISRGTPLAAVMTEQAMSVRGELQQQLLAAAGRNETRMLIPLIFLILPVTVLFAIYPSLQLLNLTYN